MTAGFVLFCFVFVFLIDRNRGWKHQDDVGYDLDDHSALCHPGHFSGGDDGQGGPPPLVPTQNGALQERQRSKLPPQVWKRLVISPIPLKAVSSAACLSLPMP